MSAPWSDYVDRFGLGMTEARLFAFLDDGEPKSIDDCLLNGFGKKAATRELVHVHVCRIRKKVKPHGYEITSGRRDGTYRLTTATPVPRSKQARAV